MPAAAAILAARSADLGEGNEIGRSREGRPIRAFSLGRGPRRVSLLAGCHADEPVGPILLRRLAGFLMALPDDDTLLTRYQWWILPHINPDGAARNRRWEKTTSNGYDLAQYLAAVVRELPGDDIEFGFPRDPEDSEARSENVAAYRWWLGAGGSYDFHASLHGMAVGAGPWFLIEPAWLGRCGHLMSRCAEASAALGYVMHDVERHGEKGFRRIQRGFCTRPDSASMRRHFLSLGDEEAAGRFRPSSMEAIRSFGGDALTVVSEMPLFITPGVGEQVGPPDPVADEWRRRLEGWRAELDSVDSASSRALADACAAVRSAAKAAGLRPMPIRDQLSLQWSLIAAGLEQVELEASS